MLRNEIMCLSSEQRQRLCSMIHQADKRVAADLVSHLTRLIEEAGSPSLSPSASPGEEPKKPTPPRSAAPSPGKTPSIGRRGSAAAASAAMKEVVLKETKEEEYKERGPLQRPLPVGLKVNAAPVVGQRLNNSTGDKPWNWKGKADRSWLERRVGELHTGNPCMDTAEEEYEDVKDMFKGAGDFEQGEGAGNFGTIFTAKRKADGCRVIIKVLRVSRSSWHKEIINEICMHEVLCQHPKLVGYHGAYQPAPDRFALVLTAFDMSLEDWINKVVKNTTSADLMTQFEASRRVAANDLLEAVRFAHTVGGKGVIHRDIKPANLLLKCDGGKIVSAALTDFGFTCVPGADHASPGTVLYQSYELLKSAPYGQPADIWALGVTLLELWTGPLHEMRDLSDDDCKERIVKEFKPPMHLGPCWEDTKQKLDDLPYIQHQVMQCFMPPKDRVKITTLSQALSLKNSQFVAL